MPAPVAPTFWQPFDYGAGHDDDTRSVSRHLDAESISYDDRAPSAGPVMATILIRASGSGVRSRASRGSVVVVMEPPENRDSRDAALELGGTRNRLLLRESLVRTRLVVEAHELGEEASEVVLAEEEDVVEQLPAQGAREPFGERVHVRCLGCNPHDTRP